MDDMYELHQMNLLMIDAVVNNDLKSLAELVKRFDFRAISKSYYYSPLHKAIQEANEEIVNFLINNSPDIDFIEEMTPLCRAMHLGHIQIAKLLLRHGADVNAQGNIEIPLLYIALKLHDKELVELLVKGGIDINAQNKFKGPALHIATTQENRDLVEFLISNGADVDIEDEYGTTALHIAVSKGNISIEAFLIKSGANVNVQTKEGATPLHASIKTGEKEVMELLIKNGANVNAQIEFKGTALHWAVFHRKKNLVELLLDNNADINLETQIDFSGTTATPLDLAVKKNDIEIVKLLLDRNADVNARNKCDTPLHVAVKVNSMNIAKLLIECKVKIDALNEWDQTPLHIAALQGNKDFAEFLIEHKANVNATYDEGYTILHAAAEGGNVELVELLLTKYDADINAQNNRDRNTPLHDACKSSNAEVIKLLITKYFADASSTNRKGETLLHSAAGAVNKGAVKFLIEHGAKIDTKDNEGFNALNKHFMFNDCLIRNDEIAKFMLNYKPEINSNNIDHISGLREINKQYPEEISLQTRIFNVYSLKKAYNKLKVSTWSYNEQKIENLAKELKEDEKEIRKELIDKTEFFHLYVTEKFKKKAYKNIEEKLNDMYLLRSHYENNKEKAESLKNGLKILEGSIGNSLLSSLSQDLSLFSEVINNNISDVISFISVEDLLKTFNFFTSQNNIEETDHGLSAAEIVGQEIDNFQVE